MSNQPENEMQQTQTPEEMRQILLAQVEASKQAIDELSDEDLEHVAGGFTIHFLKSVFHDVKEVGSVAGQYYHGIADGFTKGKI